MKLVRSLAHVCILTADLGRCEAFYCGILGLPKQFDFRRGEELIGFYLKTGDRQFIEVFRRESAPLERGNGITHFCLEVDSVAEVVTVLHRRGVECREAKLGADQSWQTWCKDPDGIDIEFHEYTPASRQLAAPGGICEVNW